MLPRLKFLTQPYNVVFPLHRPMSAMKDTGLPHGNLGTLFIDKVEKTFFRLTVDERQVVVV